MNISSPAFEPDSTIPAQYTGAGANVSPPLRFEDIPQGAQCLVLMVEDTDATPKPWVHWLVFNIPPSTAEVAEDSLPQGGTEGHANGGTHGYEGPAPQYFTGTHHYHFKLFALDSLLDLPDTATKEDVLPAMDGHIMDEAVLIGLCDGTGTALA